jgi:hypothetical protein
MNCAQLCTSKVSQVLKGFQSNFVWWIMTDWKDDSSVVGKLKILLVTPSKITKLQDLFHMIS